MIGEVKNIVVDIGNVCVFEEDGEVRKAFRELVGDEMITEVWRDMLLGYIGVEDCLWRFGAGKQECCEKIRQMVKPENMAQFLPVNQKVLELLDALRQQGYRIFYLSNATETLRDYALEYLRFDEFFDGGVFSCDSHYRKPNMAAYRALLEKYDLEPAETLLFDDKERNVRGAWLAGIEAAVFREPDDIWRGLYPPDLV